MLRDDQRYSLTSSENEAWIVGRGFGASYLLIEAINEITSIGGNVLLISPVSDILEKLDIGKGLQQNVYDYSRGTITFSKRFPDLDPLKFDIVLVDLIFHFPYEDSLRNWRKYTESSTKVIAVGTPTFPSNTDHGGLEDNSEKVKHELQCFYKVKSGSTFHNKQLPDIFFKQLLKDALDRDEGIEDFKRTYLGIC